MTQRIKVLTISDIFPTAAHPVFGVFVERLIHHLRGDCDQTVVVPYRVFPPAILFRSMVRPKSTMEGFRGWLDEVGRIPAQADFDGVDVFYQRYTSPPRPVLHGTWGFFAYAALKRKLRSLHREKGFDLIHAHYASPSGVVALLAARWMHIPVVVSVHGADVTYTARQRIAGSSVVRWVFQHADAIVANSTWTAGRIIHYGGRPEKVRVIYLGTELDGGGTPASLREDGLPEPSISLLSVGNLLRNKGHALVLAAMLKLVEMGYPIEYTIVGDGPERSELEAIAANPPLAGRVHFVGSVPHQEVWAYYRACDIFVLASRVEGFGLVFIEALAAGKPVIGCRGTGGPEDLKALGDCIELVDPDDVDELVDALGRLAGDPKRRRRMGELGRSIVAERFTWEKAARETVQVYDQVIAGHSSFDA